VNKTREASTLPLLKQRFWPQGQDDQVALEGAAAVELFILSMGRDDQ